MPFIALISVLLGHAVAGHAQPIGLPGSEADGATRLVPPLVTVRLFLDLECPYSRQAWPLWREAVQARQPAVALVVQHLPLSRHPHAQAAALAAVAARQQGKELAFIDALLRDPVPDGTAIGKAARAVGLDADAMARFVEAPQTKAMVDRERQAGLALGVRATPGALVNGRGIGGVPPEPALRRALDLATAEAKAALQDAGSAADPERLGLLKHAPEFLPAFDALRTGRALGAPAAQVPPSGQLGPRYRVPVLAHDVIIGSANASVTAVLLLDPGAPWQVGAVRDLVARQGLRVVVKLMPRTDGRGSLERRTGTLDVVLLLTALAMQQPEIAGKIMAELARKATLTAAEVEAKAQALGVDTAKLRPIQAAPATTGMLFQTLDLAARTEARPGALFLNGRKWLGLTSDAGLDAAVRELDTEARQRATQGLPPADVYDKLVAAGRWRSDAELDLQPAEQLGDTALLPVIGTAGQDVYLFVDFASPHSRAAFYMLRRHINSRDLPIRLHLASIASATEPCVTPSGAAFVVAAALGKAYEFAEKLFDLGKPNDWSALYTEIKKLKLPLAVFQKQIEAEETRAVARATASLKARLDMADEPVLYIGNRLYTGPLDEARIEKAIRFVRAPH